MGKSSWHFGIIKHLHPDGNWLSVHEIYINGEKKSWSKEPIQITVLEDESIENELKLIMESIKTHDILVVDQDNKLVEIQKHE
jgi:hypothetical protein